MGTISLKVVVCKDSLGFYIPHQEYEDNLKPKEKNRSWVPAGSTYAIFQVPDELIPRREDEVVACMGDRFILDGEDYILTFGGSEVGVMLFNLETGNRWTKNWTPVKDKFRITRKEFKNLVTSEIEEILKTKYN